MKRETSPTRMPDFYFHRELAYKEFPPADQIYVAPVRKDGFLLAWFEPHNIFQTDSRYRTQPDRPAPMEAIYVQGAQFAEELLSRGAKPVRVPNDYGVEVFTWPELSTWGEITSRYYAPKDTGNFVVVGIGRVLGIFGLKPNDQEHLSNTEVRINRAIAQIGPNFD